MELMPPSGEASAGLSPEAALAASNPHHDGEQAFARPSHGDGANVVHFHRAGSATAGQAATPSGTFAVPTVTPIPEFVRLVVAGVVEHGAVHKNIALAPDEADAVVRDVFAKLDLADFYRFSAGDPAAAEKIVGCIGDRLDDVSVRRIMILVCHVESTENAEDPAVLAIVTAILKEIATGRVSGPIIWPEPGAAVASYYRAIPAVLPEAPHDG